MTLRIEHWLFGAALVAGCGGGTSGAGPAPSNTGGFAGSGDAAAGGPSVGGSATTGGNAGATASGGAAGASGAAVACSVFGAKDSAPPPDGGSPSCAPPAAQTGDLPCDVSAVLKAKCQTCHTCPNRCGAHFPLLTYEDLTSPFSATSGKLRWQRAAEVIDAANPAGLPHMPYKLAPPLTDAEMATLAGWFQAGAPPQPDGAGCDG